MATKIGPGTIEGAPELAKADQAAVDAMNIGAGGAGGAMERRSVAMDGTMTGGGGFEIRPSFMSVAYSVSAWNANGDFGNGAFVLDKADEVAKPTKPVTAVILGVHRYWKRRLSKEDYAAKVEAAKYETKEDARRAGEVVDWPPRGVVGPKPTVSEAADFILLVRKPEGCNSTKFVLKLGPDWYTVTRFSVDKEQFRDIASTLQEAKFFEAGQRGVAPLDGRLDGYFMTFMTYGEKLANGNTIIKLKLAFLKDASGAPVPVPAQIKAELMALSEAARSSAVAADEDDLPPAGGPGDMGSGPVIDV